MKDFLADMKYLWEGKSRGPEDKGQEFPHLPESRTRVYSRIFFHCHSRVLAMHSCPAEIHHCSGPVPAAYLPWQLGVSALLETAFPHCFATTCGPSIEHSWDMSVSFLPRWLKRECLAHTFVLSPLSAVWSANNEDTLEAPWWRWQSCHQPRPLSDSMDETHSSSWNILPGLLQEWRNPILLNSAWTLGSF